MAPERFKKQEFVTFFGTFIYDRLVPEGHFPRKLDSIIDWNVFTKQLIEFYNGGAMYGRPPYDPAVLLKMLLISYLYNLSERQAEQHASDSLATKWFLGLAAEAAPHHSTLSKFRTRVIRNGRSKTFEAMLATIVGMAQEGGVQFGTVQIMDSVHTVADVNTAKDNKRQKGASHPGMAMRPGA